MPLIRMTAAAQTVFAGSIVRNISVILRGVGMRHQDIEVFLFCFFLKHLSVNTYLAWMATKEKLYRIIVFQQNHRN